MSVEIQEKDFAVTTLQHGRPVFVSPLLAEEAAERLYAAMTVNSQHRIEEETKIVSEAEARMLKRQMLTRPLSCL